jgi:beta-glucuronidase
VKGDQLLLNNKPVFLTGFGKHEDFPIHGRGLDVPVIVRDFELLKWIGANSFRTSHYPYSDEAMQLADQYGLLVIAETPAVSLDFVESAEVIATRHRQHSQALSELIARDKNHPSVILWSIANEPGLSVALGSGGDPKPMIERGTKYFQPLFDYTRATDKTRPVVLVSVGSGPDEWVGMGDIICTNLYYGWYYGGQGQLQTVAKSALESEIARLRTKHNKPIMLTEFGADTIAGTHAQPAEMWSEEYQAEMMEMYVHTLRQFPFVVGSHPWAFADFRTSQGIIRAGGINQKGVFTRDRRPKLAAHKLRELWSRSG